MAKTKASKASKKKALPKDGPGRPRKEFDFAVFEGLCRAQCTLAEMAGVLDVSEDTIERRVKEHYGQTFAEVYALKSSIGKVSLRRAQFRQAEAGNVTMLVWLGKQYLGQKDESRTKHEFDKLTDQELIAAAAGLFSRDS